MTELYDDRGMIPILAIFIVVGVIAMQYLLLPMLPKESYCETHDCASDSEKFCRLRLGNHTDTLRIGETTTLICSNKTGDYDFIIDTNNDGSTGSGMLLGLVLGMAISGGD